MAATATATKLVKHLAAGDVVQLTDPDGAARVTSIQRSRLFDAAGGCFRLDLKVTAGPHKGEKITDQHHPGEMEVKLAQH